MVQSLPGHGTITAVLKAAVDKGDVPFVTAVVVNPGGEIYKDGVGQPADAIFRVASMTKPVTSVAAMMLIEEKRIALDDPITKHLSEKDAMQSVVTMNEVGHFVALPPQTPVTVRHLLTHTSGIAYGFSNDTVNKVLQSAPSIPETSLLVHEPGARWTYGPSTRLLGDLIAAVSKQSLDVFLSERIFKPLRMNDTSFALPDEKRARLVPIYQRKGGTLAEQPPPKPPQPPQVRGDTGLYSTASDYGRFLRVFLNKGELDGQRVLTAASVQQMSTNQIGALTVELQKTSNPELSSDFPLSGAGQDAFGFGFEIAKPAKANPHRPSAGSLSWSGVMNTFFWIDPARRVGAVLLAQTLPFGDAPAARLLDAFQGAVYEGLKGA